jgi:phosphohistidine swiveling domain-containing protein
LRKLRNIARYFRYLFGQRGARRSLAQLVAELRFSPTDESAAAMWRAIDEKFDAIFDAMDWHLVSSATAGVMTPTLLGILSKGEELNEAHHSEVAALLAGAEDVESADIANGAERIQSAALLQPDVGERFAGPEVSVEDALRWLEGEESGEAGREFRRYLARHGHRAIKELELRQPEWREDPVPLVTSLKVCVASRLEDSGEERDARVPAEKPKRSDHGLGLRLLTRLAHQTVRSREETKSGLVAVTARFKEAYRELARRLVAEGRLPDEDAVFFLMHEELGALISGAATDVSEDHVSADDIVRRATNRRSVFDRQSALQFPDVFAGEAAPIIPELPDDATGKRVTGTSVSRGVVVGTARVVRTPAEAEALVRGEILIAPITDVGWTPYFTLISGLVTDIGSEVSHGAVVAREFGLPAIVNTRYATQVFQTGDRVLLDADRGLVELCDGD